MDRVLSDFIVSLRHAGVRISVSETLDALQSVRLVGYNDRETLRDALLAALPKSAPEKEIFARCFDHFFSFDYFADADAAAGPDSAPVGAETDFSLTRTLLSGDRTALVMAMREAARAANLTDIRFFTQQSLYTLRILDRMGLPALDAQIQAMQAAGSPGAAQQSGRAGEGEDLSGGQCPAVCGAATDAQHPHGDGEPADVLSAPCQTVQAGTAAFPGYAHHYPAHGQTVERPAFAAAEGLPAGTTGLQENPAQEHHLPGLPVRSDSGRSERSNGPISWSSAISAGRSCGRSGFCCCFCMD